MTQAHPDITCTKCSTVVPWGPHCPYCRAYLEFSGIPPWQPDEPEHAVDEAGPAADASGEPASPSDASPSDSSPSETGAEAAAPSEAPGVAAHHADAEQGDVSQSSLTQTSSDGHEPEDSDEVQPLTESVLLAEAITGASAAKHVRPVEPSSPRRSGSWALLRRGWRRQPRRNLAASIFAVVLALLVVWLLSAVSGSDRAWLTAPVFVLCALVAVAIFGTIPDQLLIGDEPPPEIEPTTEPVVVEPVSADESDASSVEQEVMADDDGIRSREPQLIAATAEKSKPLLSGASVNRDVTCDSCGHVNLRGASYCAICGVVLAGAQVAPDVIAYSLVDDDDTDDSQLTADGKRKQRRRRITGSWRNAIVALTLIGIVVGAFLFAFFGPGALRVQFGMVQAFQIVNQWIDPYTGSPATVTNVTASSSLLGTSAIDLKDADSRTFWASAALPNYGAGSTLTFTLDEPTLINRMVIYPGVQNLQFDRRALATPRDFTLTFDNGSSVAGTLLELSSANEVRQLVKFPDVTTKTIVLTLNSVYSPIERSNDNVGEVALSGVDFLKVPQAPAVFRFQQGSRVPGLPGMNP